MRIHPDTVAKKLFHDVWGAATNLLAAKTPSHKSQVPTLKIQVGETSYRSLNQEILKYGFGELPSKPKIRGYIRNSNNEVIPVKVGYRGANSWHHQYWKPSLQVRLKKDMIQDGFRKHVLVAPEDGVGLRNWLSIKLADDWDMITYKEHFVRLYINGHYKGLYTRFWPLDESLLIHLDKLPGPFFRMEGGVGPVFRRIGLPMFNAASYEAIDIDPEGGRVIIQNLLNAIQIENPVIKIRKVNELIDREEMSKFLTLLSHAGSNHYITHNIAYWLNRTTGRLVPILIDVNGYGMDWPERDLQRPIINGNIFTLAWLEDPRNLELYTSTLYDYLFQRGSYPSLKKIIDSTWQIIKPELESDMFLSDMGAKNRLYVRTMMPVTSLENDREKLLSFIDVRIKNLRQFLTADSIYFYNRDENSFEVLITGVSGFVAHSNDQKKTDVQPKFLLPTYSPIKKEAFAIYRLPGLPSDYTFSHRLTHQVYTPSKAGFNMWAYRKTQGVHFDELPKSRHPVRVTLGPGVVRVEEDVEYGSEVTLSVLPGTEIILSEKKTILIRGPVKFSGTKKDPIRIRPASPGRPFGVIALIDDVKGSTIVEYVDIQGGSTYRRDNLYFSGMFSIRNRSSVTITNSRFGRNYIGDDAVHAVRSEVTIEKCLFTNSRADAVDFDGVEGVIRNSTFRQCGNDCFDVSMSEIESFKNSFENCGDKCISVGEGSLIQVRDSKFIEGINGIAVKDKSKLLLKNASFLHCDTSLNFFRKKWQWEKGGQGWIDSVSISGSKSVDIHIGKRSQLFSLRPVPEYYKITRRNKIQILTEKEFRKQIKI